MRKTKNHCNQLLYGLICLILIVIGFTSCEAEKNFANENAKINYVKINDVPFLIPVIQQFNHSYDYLSNPSLKDNNSKILNLNLDIENIIEYVYANGLKTYSVKINKEFQENEDKYFENLHIYEKNMVYESFVLKYNEIDDNKIFDITNFTGDIEIYDTNYVFQGLIQFERGRREHTKIIHGGWHIWIHNGTVDVWNTELDPGSSTGSNNYNPNEQGFLFIAAAPTTIIENSGGGNTSLTVPCEMLKALANPQIGNIKPEIDFLKEKVENDETNNTEWNVSIKTTMNADNSFTYTKTITEGESMGAPIITGDFYIGGAHNHPSNGYDIPAWGDVKALRDTYEMASTSREPEVHIMVVCKDDYTGEKLVYALIVENFSNLNSAVNNVWNSDKYHSIIDEKNRLEKINSDISIEFEKNKQNLEKIFLQLFSSYGITLLKATNDDLTEWEKLDLNNDPSLPIGNQLTVQRTPCN